MKLGYKYGKDKAKPKETDTAFQWGFRIFAIARRNLPMCPSGKDK